VRLARAVTVVTALMLLPASNAAADWLFTPFLGGTFAPQIPIVNLEQSAGTTKVVVGGSTALLSDGIFGIEGDFGYSPRFFERSSRTGLNTGSNVTTVFGNVVVTMPLSVTRESLRPYGVAGMGLMHAAAAALVVQLFDIDQNLLGYDFGGGAIGMFDPNVGVRFDLRRFQTVHELENQLTQQRSHLSFWRATVGVTVRY
jgi:outer membrane protein with beta-barrel domain